MGIAEAYKIQLKEPHHNRVGLKGSQAKTQNLFPPPIHCISSKRGIEHNRRWFLIPGEFG